LALPGVITPSIGGILPLAMTLLLDALTDIVAVAFMLAFASSIQRVLRPSDVRTREAGDT